ncbi:MAG: response regulator transcription factor, partial [Bdellovibrionia bacterium]
MNESQSILIVEDEEPIRQGLISLFVYHGFKVTSVTDGEAAIETARGGNFDLIVLDVMLPKKDGFTVCHELRAAKLTVPIIMLTARTSEDDIVNGFQLGADDYVTKPFSVRELLSRVQAILRRTKGPPVETIEIGTRLKITAANLEGVNDGKRILFTHREIEILKYLLAEN